jgi:hypothetical protein
MKHIAIFRVEGYSKTGTDQAFVTGKGEESVTTHLKADSWNPGARIGAFTLHSLESKAPEWKDGFIVTLEPLPPKPEGADYTGYLKQVIAEKLDPTPAPSGRKIR